MAKRRRFTAAFKARVAKEALRGDRTVQQIAARHELHPNQVSQWKRTASERLAELFERGSRPGQDEREAELRKLHEKIGQLVVERDFLKSAWER
jgi:transposase